MDFNLLSQTISNLNQSLRGAAAISVNRLLTMRNWLIGMHIVEYEQNGEDRATYGAALLEKLSRNLSALDVKSVSVAALRNYRQFYTFYPQFRKVIIKEAEILLPLPIQQQPAVEFQPVDYQSVSNQSPAPEQLLKHFSFSHFVELMRIQDPHKCALHETQGASRCWNVLQLKHKKLSEFGFRGLWD